jgi:hypothetical protein
MKKSRIIANIILLVIVAVVVFMIGWVQILVKPGQAGVLVTKTNGVSEKLILPGKFSWKWQRLLPTNAQIRVFNMSPYSFVQNVKGQLPSSEIYSKQIKENPDFSYNVSLNIQIKASEKGLSNIVKNTDAKKDDDLKVYLEIRSAVLAKIITDYLFEQALENPKFIANSITKEMLSQIVKINQNEFENVEITDIAITNAQIPDLDLYNKAKASYQAYLDSLTESLKKLAAEDAKNVLEDDRIMQRLEKFAALLEKYPQLQDVFKTNDASAIMNAIKAFR